MAFIRMFQIKPALPIDLLIERLQTLRNGIGGHTVETHTGERHTAGSQLETNTRSDAGTPMLPDRDLHQAWSNLVEKLSDKSPALVASLTKCVLKKVSGQTLEIEVADNGFNLNMISRGKNMAILNDTCKEFFGKPMEIRLIAKENQESDAGQKKKTALNALKQEALSHPLVMSAMEIFDGKLVDVKIRE
jgi:DNA polymerase-3 subunit gamma/tau